MNEQIDNRVKEMINTIEATNVFLDDKDKINLDASKKALETHSEEDIARAIEEATAIKNKGVTYGDTLLESLNNMLNAYANESYNDYQTKKEADRVAKDRLASIDAGNAFFEEKDKLSTTAIHKALETHDADDISLAIEEAVAIKNSGNAYADQMLSSLNQIMKSYTGKTYDEYKTDKELEKQEEALINSTKDKISAIEASNTFVEEKDMLKTDAIKQALETRNENDLVRAIEEAEVVKNSGNPYGEQILDTLNKIMVKKTGKTYEESKNTIDVDSMVKDKLSAIEASNTFLDDKDKLSTEAINRALATHKEEDIAKAKEEAEAIKNSGNAYGEQILDILNLMTPNAEEKVEIKEEVVAPIEEPVMETVVEETPVVEEVAVEEPTVEPVEEATNEEVNEEVTTLALPELEDKQMTMEQEDEEIEPSLDDMVLADDIETIDYSEELNGLELKLEALNDFEKEKRAENNRTNLRHEEAISDYDLKIEKLYNELAATEAEQTALDAYYNARTTKLPQDVIGAFEKALALSEDSKIKNSLVNDVYTVYTQMETREKKRMVEDYIKENISNIPLAEDNTSELAQARAERDRLVNEINEINAADKEIFDKLNLYRGSIMSERDSLKAKMNGTATKAANSEAAVEEEHELTDDEILNGMEFMFESNDEPKVEMTPIMKIKTIGKDLYDKISSVNYKKIINKALDYIKEHAVQSMIALVVVGGIGIAAGLVQLNNNAKDDTKEEFSDEHIDLDAYNEENGINQAQDNNETEVTLDVVNEEAPEQVVEEIEPLSFEEQAQNALEQVQNGDALVYSNVYNASQNIDGQAPYMASWENAEPSAIYANVDGGMQQVTADVAENLDSYEVVYENNGTPIGAVHVDNTVEETGMSK